MKRRLMLLALAGVAAGMLLFPLTASAHSLPVPNGEHPAPGQTLTQPPSNITITFDERPDPKLSKISVVDSSGTEWDKGDTAPLANDSNTLRVDLRQPLPKGVYTVTWRTVSAIDGHLVTNSYAFGVGVSPPANSGSQQNSSSSSPSASAAAIIARALLYLGLIAMIGALASRLFVTRCVARGAMAMIVGGWAIALVGAVWVTAKEAIDASVVWGDLFETSIGQVGAERVIVAGITGVGVIWLWFARRRGGSSLLPFWIALIGGIGSLFVDALASHATSQSIVPLNVAAQWLHVTAVAVWIGGLAALLLALPSLTSEDRGIAAKRFAKFATVGIIVVGLTGIYRAVIEVGTWSALTTTTFGILVIVKSVLLILLAALGSVNHFRNVPRAKLSIKGLTRFGSMEMVAGIAAITVAAALVNVAPPISTLVSVASSQQVVVSGADLGTTIRMQLTVSPGQAGINVFDAKVTDYDTGKPITNATSVQLTFTFSGAAAIIGQSTLDLKNNGNGDFSASGPNLSLNGPWSVTALVERGVQSADVTLQLTTNSTPPQVDIIRTAGLPTVYTIHLTNGRTAQVYLDPGKPGANEFHITFFDAQGNELPVVSATIVQTPPKGQPVALDLTELEPGHFVANVNAPSGASRFDIAGVTQSGEHLVTYVRIVPGS
jgi:copper transport protein